MSSYLSTDLPPALVDQPQQGDLAVEAASTANQWVETALAVMFTATAVLFVSFVAVVAGLV